MKESGGFFSISLSKSDTVASTHLHTTQHNLTTVLVKHLYLQSFKAGVNPQVFVSDLCDLVVIDAPVEVEEVEVVEEEGRKLRRWRW